MAKKSKSTLNKKMTFSGTQVLLFVLAFAAVGAVAIWQSLAAPHNGGGKPSHGGSDSISLVMATDNNSDGLPNFGDKVTFNVSSSYATPSITLDCYQAGNLVASGSHPMYRPNIWDDPGIFSLSSQAWTGGTADCTAMLIGQGKNARPVTLATLSFQVNQ